MKKTVYQCDLCKRVFDPVEDHGKISGLIFDSDEASTCHLDYADSHVCFACAETLANAIANAVARSQPPKTNLSRTETRQGATNGNSGE